jgi:hypothetical protein
MPIYVDKGKRSDLLLKKLGEVNDIRMKLGLPMRSIDEYKHTKPDETPGINIQSYGYDHIPSSNSKESPISVNIDPNGPEIQDLSRIPIPKGVAPDTEGQIFKSLTQLRTIRCRSSKKPYPAASQTPAEPDVPKTQEPSQATEPQIVIAAAPQLRDLQKELLHMKPVALRRKAPVAKPVDPFE